MRTLNSSFSGKLSIKPGRILFEVDGVSEAIAREALYKASAKLPIKTKFVKRN